MPTSPYAASIRQREIDLKEVAACLRALDPNSPDAVERALSRYLVVRAVGYLEATRDDLADEFARRSGNSRVHRRVVNHLRQGLGVAPKQLLDFLGSFDVAWRADLESILDADDQKLRSELGALVAARKKIAHGDGEQVTVSRSLLWSETGLSLGNHLKRIFGV